LKLSDDLDSKRTIGMDLKMLFSYNFSAKAN